MVPPDPLVMQVNEVDLETLDHLVLLDLKGKWEILELREFVELLEFKDQKVELVLQDHQDWLVNQESKETPVVQDVVVQVAVSE